MHMYASKCAHCSCILFEYDYLFVHIFHCWLSQGECTTRLGTVGSVPRHCAPLSRMRAVARRLYRWHSCRAERRANARRVALSAAQRATAAQVRLVMQLPTGFCRAARRRSVQFEYPPNSPRCNRRPNEAFAAKSNNPEPLTLTHWHNKRILLVGFTFFRTYFRVYSSQHF